MERKNVNRGFKKFLILTHYSTIPTFHYSMSEAVNENIKTPFDLNKL